MPAADEHVPSQDVQHIGHKRRRLLPSFSTNKSESTRAAYPTVTACSESAACPAAIHTGLQTPDSRVSTPTSNAENGKCKSWTPENCNTYKSGLPEDSRSPGQGRSPGYTYSGGQERENCQTPLEGMQVCYGMLVDITVMREMDASASDLNSRTSVTLVAESLYEVTPNTPCSIVGKLNPPSAYALNSLSAEEVIDIQLYVSAWSPKTSISGTRQNQSTEKWLALCAIVYGPRHNGVAVGDFLQDCKMYLQDPRHCDRDVPYENPHRFEQDPVTTFNIFQHVENSFENFIAPQDILQDLEATASLEAAQTPSALKTELKDHQMRALTFMRTRERGWRLSGEANEFWRQQRIGCIDKYEDLLTGESRSEIPREFCGGILADQMGLGKSLSMIALVADDLDPPFSSAQLTTLIVVRATLLETWQQQLREHVHPGRIKWKTHHGKSRLKTTHEMAQQDVILTTYHTLAREQRDISTSGTQVALFDMRWHRVILDEAHDIRNISGVLAKAVNSLSATCRWAVTGTPIQNRLWDLNSLFTFLRVDPFENPVYFRSAVRRLCTDPTIEDGPERLRKMLKCIMLRRSISKVELPSRQDRLVKVDFNDEEQALYDRVRATVNEDIASEANDSDKLSILQLISRLRTICNLGLRGKFSETEGQSRSAAANLIVDQSTAQNCFNSMVAAGNALCGRCSTDLSVAVSEIAAEASGEVVQPRLWTCSWLACGDCSATDPVPHCSCANRSDHYSFPVTTICSAVHIGSGNSASQHGPSTKIQAVLRDLDSHLDDEKGVVFSYWTSTLDMIQEALRQKGIGHIRYDGSLSNAQRSRDLNSFSKDPTKRVALLTISCGAVGLNLTAASRVYLMEPNWNPAVEQQALARIYRMGQERPVVTTRYVMRGTLEEHVLSVQDRKTNLSSLLLSEQGGTNSDIKARPEQLHLLLQS